MYNKRLIDKENIVWKPTDFVAAAGGGLGLCHTNFAKSVNVFFHYKK